MPKIIQSARRCQSCGAMTSVSSEMCDACQNEVVKKPYFSLKGTFKEKKAEVDAKTLGKGDTPFMRFLVKIGRFFWLVYLVILVFILYFTALFSG